MSLGTNFSNNHEIHANLLCYCSDGITWHSPQPPFWKWFQCLSGLVVKNIHDGHGTVSHSFGPDFRDFFPALTYMSISVCLFVCLFVFPVFFLRRLIGWYTGFWQWFWHPTYPTRCLELGWAVPHSDFLAWLSSATLKKFISGVSSRISMR